MNSSFSSCMASSTTSPSECSDILCAFAPEWSARALTRPSSAVARCSAALCATSAQCPSTRFSSSASGRSSQGPCKSSHDCSQAQRGLHGRRHRAERGTVPRTPRRDGESPGRRDVLQAHHFFARGNGVIQLCDCHPHSRVHLSGVWQQQRFRARNSYIPESSFPPSGLVSPVEWARDRAAP